MQVLKFGGSSVGSPEAINQMVSIVSERLQKEKTIVVVSAMSGVTDQLIILAQTAAKGDEAYKTIIQNIEQKHLDTVLALLPNQQQSVTSYTTTKCYFKFGEATYKRIRNPL